MWWLPDDVCVYILLYFLFYAVFYPNYPYMAVCCLCSCVCVDNEDTLLLLRVLYYFFLIIHFFHQDLLSKTMCRMVSICGSTLVWQNLLSGAFRSSNISYNSHRYKLHGILQYTVYRPWCGLHVCCFWPMTCSFCAAGVFCTRDAMRAVARHCCISNADAFSICKNSKLYNLVSTYHSAYAPFSLKPSTSAGPNCCCSKG